MIRSGFLRGLRLERDRLAGNRVAPGQPAAEVDQPAALAAERPVRRILPVDGTVTGGTGDLHGASQAQVVSRKGTSSVVCVACSDSPFQVRKRTLQR